MHTGRTVEQLGRLSRRCISYQSRHFDTTRTYTTKSQQFKSPHDPLNPTIPTSNLGLPLIPQPALNSLRSTQPLVSSDLERLHRLSALNPPLPGSKEEKELLEGLNELVGLMEAVKAVQLPEGKEAVGELLNRGVGEDVIGEETGTDRGTGEVEGRELLRWATRRKGDYYHSRAGKRTEEIG
jgi:Arc/MetJ family transcription regulator